MSTRSLLAVVSAGLVCLATTTINHAAESPYPNKPIRLIIPFPPGGSADPLGRAIGQWFTDKLGVTVVSDNRPGAGTAIAHTLAARAAPDGYTLILGASSGLTTNPAFGSKLDYDPVKDFAHVSMAAYVPQVVVTYPSVPAKTMSELIDLAKAQPGKVIFGSPGAGTVGHLSIEWLNSAAGVKFTHVPYKGAGPGMLDLMGGRIQAFVGSVTSAQTQIASGKMRAIATGHTKRLRAMPDLPTVAETVPGFTNNGWYGLSAPAGTSAAIVNKLNAELKRALADATFAKHIETIGMEPSPGSTPQEMREWIRTEIARWTKVVRDAGIQGQGG